MKSLAIVMAVDDDPVFDKGDVIEILHHDAHAGNKVYNHPKLQIIKLPDMTQLEASTLLTPEFDVLMNVVKPRAKKLEVEEIPKFTKKGEEFLLSKSEIISKIKVKDIIIDSQEEPVIVG